MKLSEAQAEHCRQQACSHGPDASQLPGSPAMAVQAGDRPADLLPIFLFFLGKMVMPS